MGDLKSSPGLRAPHLGGWGVENQGFAGVVVGRFKKGFLGQSD